MFTKLSLEFTLLGAALSLSTPVFAAGPTACVDWMPCGIYEGPGQDYDAANVPEADTNFIEHMEITAVDGMSVNIKQKMWEPGKPNELFYQLDLNVVFTADGAYKAIRQDGRLYAAGISQTSKVCTLSMIPFTNSLGTVTGNVNILRFEDGKLARTMMASIKAGDVSYQRSELTKQ